MEIIKERMNKELVKNILIAIVAYGATYFLPYIISFKEPISFSNSMLTLVIWIAFFYLLKRTILQENKEKLKNILPLGLIFSTFLVLGNSINTTSKVEFNNIKTYIAIVTISAIIDAILVIIYQFIEKFETSPQKEKIPKLTGKKRYIMIFIFIFICWIPAFLAAYPGYFCYDAYSQFAQVFVKEITAWHPVVHTLLLAKTIIHVGVFTNSINMGIATYTVLQMLIIDSCLTYAIYFLEKYKVSKVIQKVGLLYYAFFPVIVMFAMCSTKDSLFSAFALVSILVCIEALLDKEKFIQSKFLQIRFVLILFLAIIFRNNAIYAYIPFLILFSIIFGKKRILILYAAIMILYGIYVGPIYALVGVKKVETQTNELLSVPLQQIARVYRDNYESLTQEQLEKIQQYITLEQLETYRPKLSDPIKGSANLKQIGYTNFFKLWIEIGRKNLRNLSRILFRKHIRILVPRHSN